MREVIRRGDEVSYIEPGVEPFTIESGNMVAPTIPMLNTDVAELSRYYDFVKVGRAEKRGRRAKYCAWFRKMVYVTRMLSGSMKKVICL